MNSDRSETQTTEWVRKRDPFWLPALLYVYILVAVPYIIWRTSIINWDIWYGPLVYFAEIYGFITTTLFLFVTQKIYEPVHRAAINTPEVDALICTYSESIDILEPVVIGALNIEGINKVLVLDDGNRPQVKKMAKRLGVKYYPRTTNLHAKAGNMNNGLAYSQAEFVIMLDADHIPLPTFVEQTIGFFDDKDLAFVQTPQTFYNTSSFLFRRRRSHKAAWSEQGMFYDCIQPAKNRWNSAFFVGTSAILRRSAIDSVGGFATGTATEDIHTSLRLHARGWKSIFLSKPLAYGLEAENIKEFYKQRKRWAAGSLGLLFRSPDSPLRVRGLSFKQRLNYLSATLAHLQGVQKLCFFVTPIVTIFSQVSPIHGSLGSYSYSFLIFFLVALTATWAYSRGTYHFLYTEAYSLASMMAHFGGIKGVIKVQKKFAVSTKTSKRRERTWLTKILWLFYWLAAMAVVQAAVLYFAEDNHSALVLYCFVFLIFNLAILLSFLLHLHIYQRSTKINDYEVLTPQERYSYIISKVAPGNQAVKPTPVDHSLVFNLKQPGPGSVIVHS